MDSGRAITVTNISRVDCGRNEFVRNCEHNVLNSSKEGFTFKHNIASTILTVLAVRTTGRRLRPS